MFYLMMHFITGHIVKDLPERKRKPAATTTWAILSD